MRTHRRYPLDTSLNEGRLAMYLRILKKDLRRKRALNIILLLFITLASMFVSSSMNNILSVTTGLDNYLEMADAPDYLLITANKSGGVDVDGILNSAVSVERFGREKILYLMPKHICSEKEDVAISGTNVLQSDRDLSMNYFLDDGSILKNVKSGEIYLTTGKAEGQGLAIGDKLTIEIEGVSREFSYAGGVKDAALGSNSVSIQRYIINGEDFEKYFAVEKIERFYGGELIYIHTPDMDAARTELKELVDHSFLTVDRAMIKFTYVFDMMVAGILLVVSLILIAVAFVVLRFTISFTLSEEFREIGVMKAIGIGNLKIRGLYLTKYAALSVVGALIGLVLSVPFRDMLMSVSTKSIIIGRQNSAFVSIICAALVVGIILLFCFGCTGKVKKMSPIDAIRNGQTGERFRKKSRMSFGVRLPAAPFLALNDMVSSPRRYGIVAFTFFLCLSLLLMLSGTVSTMKSGTLYHAFGLADYDVVVSQSGTEEFLTEDGHEKVENYLAAMEQTLADNGMPTKCMQEIMFSFPVAYGENEAVIETYQGTGTTMDMYEYTEGTAPQAAGEIAITRLSADRLKAGIGDTITVKMVDGDRRFIITAFFQSMMNRGEGLRLHEDEEINYIQGAGGFGTQILFTDHPDRGEIARRIKKIDILYPDHNGIQTREEMLSDMMGVTDTLDAVKSMIVVLTVILAVLITVLMERSFIAREQGEIALMKAVGMQNATIYTYHVARFAFVGIAAVLFGEILAVPLTHLCIDPIFRMMGMELSVDYVWNPVETWLVFPLVILATTVISALLTSLYTRKITPIETASIE